MTISNKYSKNISMQKKRTMQQQSVLQLKKQVQKRIQNQKAGKMEGEVYGKLSSLQYL